MPKNTITIIPDGPLHVQGEFRVYDTIGRLVEHSGEIFLCRCGASKNKPVCDGSHEALGFKDNGVFNLDSAESLEAYSPLVISCRPNGMLVAKGPVTLLGTDGKAKLTRNKAALCRCGASRNKPFCDVTHKKVGFQDDALVESKE